MAQGKNQHFVPQFYFRNFSKDKKSICVFNLKNNKFIPLAAIKKQCSKDYFYSKNPKLETCFSKLESMANRIIGKIIRNKNLSCLNIQEKKDIKYHMLFQHGRTEYIRDAEEENANFIFDMMKPNFLEYAQKKGSNITIKDLNNCKIKLNSHHSLLLSMVFGPLLYDLDLALLQNNTEVDFVFSDNPTILFNSFFNNKTTRGTQGIASRGLQIYFPINSKLALLAFDPNFYELSHREIITISKKSDVQRLNGLQIVFCNQNVYFEDMSMQESLSTRYMQLESKRTPQKVSKEFVKNVAISDGACGELWKFAATKVNYKLEKLSFLNHKKNSTPYGVRNKVMLEALRKKAKAIEDGYVS